MKATEIYHKHKHNKKIKEHEMHSWTVPYYTTLTWIFFAITIVGCLADVLFMADAFQRLGLKVTILDLLIYGSNTKTHGATKVDSVVSLVLAIIVCVLCIAFMFKAGSIRTESKSRASKLYIATWMLLGAALVFMRLYITVTHIKVSEDNPDQLESFTEMIFSHGLKEVVIAAILLILYIGTGISAYISGKSLGNTHINSFHHMRKKIEKEQRKLIKELSSSYTKYQKCVEILEYEQKCIREISAIVNSKQEVIDMAIQDLVVKKFRLAGIVVNEDLLPVKSNNSNSTEKVNRK